MIRDPRDVVVSGYFYHLWTTESWAHDPKPEFGGQSYQQHLRSLNRDTGLIAEIDKCRYVFQKMRDWNYHNPAICELKYEDVFAAPDTHFSRLFRHYGLHEHAISTAMTIASKSSFQVVTGRKPGVVQEQTVTRSGIPGQWKEHFSPKVMQHFEKSTSGLLEHLGYDTGAS